MIETGKTIGLCCDHAGVDLKAFAASWLQANGYKTTDYGTYSTDSCDYPDFAHKLGSAITKGEHDYGISICGTGNGISMTMNKYPKVRCALCWKEEIAALAREHNNANVLAMPPRFITDETAEKVLEAFFSTAFAGGRHQRRIDKIPEILND